MMNKIIYIPALFSRPQTIYIFENGKRTDAITCTVDKINEKIIEAAQKYKINDVKIAGATAYSKKIIKDLQHEALTNYNLTLNIMN